MADRTDLSNAIVDDDTLFQGYHNSLRESVVPTLQAGVFGGDSSDGAFDSAGANTLTPGHVYEYSNFQLQDGGTIASTATNSELPIFIKVAGSCIIDGNINLSGVGVEGGSGGGANGDRGQSITNTHEGGQGSADNGDNSGGGGGGAGTGHAGQVGSGANGGDGSGGTWLINRGLNPFLAVVPGAGGGGAGNSASASTASGGDGGGAIYIECAGDFTFGGSVSVAGFVGQNGNTTNIGGGGGGGGGAFIGVFGGSLVNTGVFETNGGAGGTPNGTGGDGGRGGSGLCVFYKQVTK